MKNSIRKSLREGWTTLGRTVRRYPVECLLLTVLAVGSVLAAECDWSLLRRAQIALLPFFAVLALVANRLTAGTARRWLYRFGWLPLLSLLFVPGLVGWTSSSRYAVALLLLVPLAVLLAGRARDNRRFMEEAFAFLRAAFRAFLFSYVALGLFLAILWSAAYIFGFDDAQWVGHVLRDATILTQTLFVPTIFLGQLDRPRTAASRSRWSDALLHYAITPALIAYAAILAAYIVRILALRSLPKGGVAYMVLIFALVAFLAEGWRMLTARRTAQWFYGRLSWILLPAAALFWVGVARRIGEFGLTDDRVYLLVSGLTMSIAILLFLSRRTGRFLWVCLAAFLLFGAVVFVPALSPGLMGVRSQIARARAYAAALGQLAPDGRFAPRPVSQADTARREEWRQLFAALEYVEWHDEAMLDELGIEPPVANLAEKLLPRRLHDYILYGIETDDACSGFEVTLPSDFSLSVDPRYRHLYPALREQTGAGGYTFEQDTLRIRLGGDVPPLRIGRKELQAALLDGSGYRPGEPVPSGEALGRLLEYRDAHARILFRSLYFRQCDSDRYELSGLTIETVMTP